MRYNPELLEFEGLPAAVITETEDQLTITAPPICGVDDGQEVVFFLRNPLGSGIAIYLTLKKANLKKNMEVVLDKSQLPKSKELHIDYGAYVNQRAVHRSAVTYFPAPATA
ncbi:hypothetical protein [Pseudomonas sp. L13]|uniref:hypothetical protein n=1 Tax=Pseudomonas sp. L13 TaxID=343985 RepID=UPI00137A9475|nr:hypothetical protein [Pseudomonas sp. L13]NCE90650.1 hypothetical protein [Pseudomonas sp. L13]